MGRIKTALIKRNTNLLIAKHKEEFKDDFDSNKLLVESFLDKPNKKIRNIIAGYVTRLMKNKELL